MPLPVSVVLCTFNDERTIKEAIESILCQSYNNFEFIIWNDGSTDGTEEIIKSYKDNRIRYFFHENTGLGVALRLACAEAKGKYIARMDGDDICLPNRIQKQVEFLESHPDYVLVSSAVYYIDENGEQIGRSFPITWDVNLRKALKYGSPIAHPASMFTREAYLKAGGYLPLYSAQDRVLWSKMKDCGKFKNLSNPLIKYRKANTSIGAVLSGEEYWDILESFRKKLANQEIVDIEDVYIYNQICKHAKEKYKREHDDQRRKRNTGLNNRFYNIVQPILGERISANTIILCKNVVCFLKIIWKRY